MQIIERLLSVIAPHYCIGCGLEGQLLCGICSQNVPKMPMVVCKTHLPGVAQTLCGPCQNVMVDGLWAAGLYAGTLEKLVHLLKFGRTQAAADSLILLIDQVLPPMPAGTLVVPLPTSPHRVRQRGYDQAVLLAKRLAAHRHYGYTPLLRRQHYRRQVGASKNDRQQQAASAYVLAWQAALQTPIVLIDDVMTTGASLQAAAATLRRAGYAHVSAAVAAYAPLSK